MAGDTTSRTQVRIAVSMPVTYAELVPGVATEGQRRHGSTCDLSAGGLCLVLDEPPPLGTYIRLDLHPDFAPALEDLQATVVEVTPSPAGQEYRVRARFVAPRQEELHALLYACHCRSAGSQGVCAEIRHCGDLRNDCPAANGDVNCWQIDKAPCCHWQNSKQCVRCPVTMLAFLE